MGAHLAAQGGADFGHLVLDVGMAGLPHQGLAAHARDLVEEHPARLDVGDDRRPRLFLQDFPGQDHQKLIPPQHPALAVDDADPVAVAVKGDAEVAALIGDRVLQLLQVAFHRRVRMVGGKRAVDFVVEKHMAAGKAAGELPEGLPGGAVAGVPGDLQGRLTGLKILQQPGRVIIHDGFFGDIPFPLGKIAGGGPIAQQPDVIGEKRLAADDQFNAVVFGRVVRPGDHQSGVDAQRLFGVIQHRRRPESDANNADAGRRKPLDQGRLQVGRREPAVITDGGAFAAPVAQNRPEGAADGASGGIIQGFRDNAPDVIFAEDGRIEPVAFGHGKRLPFAGA